MGMGSSVMSNIRLVNLDATIEEVKEACRQAEALNFIYELEDGFDTKLGRGGINLSGG